MTKRNVFRKGMLEFLERREMLAADWNPSIVAMTGAFLTEGARSQAIEYIQSHGGSTFGSTLNGGPEGANDGLTQNVTEIEPNNGRSQAQFIPLGLGPNQFQGINLTGTSPAGDMDWVGFDLKAGDIIDIRLTTGAAPFISLYGATGSALATTTNVFGDAIVPPMGPPELSPLTGSTSAPQGLVSLHYVIPTDGRYYASLSEIYTSYTANFRVYRPYIESQPAGTQQILFLDFDGGFVSRSTFGAGTGNFVWGGIDDFAENFGLFSPAAVNLFIDQIIDVVKDKFEVLGSRTTNPNFGIQILNSRDHGDLWGLPNVSRVMVGGSMIPDDFLDDNEGLLGIAQSVDVGNFATEETAIVLADRLAPIAFSIPVASSSTVSELAANLIGEVIAHEAGHYLGGWHQALNSLTTLMDWATDGAGMLGNDFIFGTPDDTSVHFEVDAFSGYDYDEDAPRSGQFLIGGKADTINTLGWGLTTGQVGGNVTGVVFRDTNLNRTLDSSDLRLSDIFVYADLNNNGTFDALEPHTYSGADGTYKILVVPGTYTIRAETPVGFRSVAPTNGSYTVTVAMDGTVSGRNFGYELIQSSITGRKFNDLNGNGLRDQGEPGIGGTWLYIDLDGDRRLDIGEPAVKSNPDGTYLIPWPGVGTFTFREVIEPGWVQTLPGPTGDYGYTVVLTGDPEADALALSGLDFGNRLLVDFGDAPQSYGSANHGYIDGLSLGTQWDSEGAPQYSAAADGDDLNGDASTGSTIDDEDGVVLVRPLVRGSNDNQFQITTTNSTGQLAYLNAWLDMNANGTFDSGERILTNMVLGTGSHNVTFSIPASAQLGTTFARFRYGLESGLGPTGGASSGEVEDYMFTIVSDSGIAQDDSATVQANSALNQIDVLANDFLAGATDTLQIVATSGLTSAGGQASISPTGDRILYTPPAGFIGVDTFTYSVVNSFGQQDSATVSITVNLFFEDPIAIDDSFDVPTNSADFPLNVLANDIEGQAGALSIISVTQPNRGGLITIATGGKSLRYTPVRDFGGTEMFTYTAVDADGNRVTATVTLHTLPGDRVDDLVSIQLVAVDLNGNPISQIEQGKDFKIQVYVDDLRYDSSNPGVSAGVYSAYFDFLYNVQLATLKPENSPGSRFNFDVDFFNQYINFTTGDASIPGVINEFGATSDSDNMQVPDPVLMAEVTFTARAAGIVDFFPDPADGIQSDTLLFNEGNQVVPVEKIRFLGTQIEVFGDGAQFPVAVDDSVAGSVPVNSIRYQIDVLANDLKGSTGSVTIASVTQPTRGTVQIENRGGNPADKILTFTPNTGFTGFQQFTYTIEDARGIRSTATVSVRVGAQSTSDIIGDFDLVVTDLNGTPIDEVTLGSQFQLRAYVQDGRGAGPNRGLFTAYMDVLYNSTLVSPVPSNTNDPDLGFVVSFGPTYNQVREGDVRTPGLINEIGAQSNSETPVGSNRFLLYTITLTADRTGLASFIADPADISPFHDSLTYIPAEPIPLDKIRFGFDQVRIVSAGGSSGGEFHNSNRPLDVNNDGHISPIDALLIINQLNGTGHGASGEGENSYFPDTNNDGRVSPVDALLVINHLNMRGSNSGGEGEGESADGLGSPLIESRLSAKPLVENDFLSDAIQETTAKPATATPTGKPQLNSQFATMVDQAFQDADDKEDELNELVDILACDGRSQI